MKVPPGSRTFINQQIPGYSGAERPDVVIIDETQKIALIMDVTVAFENRPQAFVTARAEKIKKYSALSNHLHTQGLTTKILVFVMGSLGGYDKSNVETLIALGIGRRYSVLMKRLMVSDTIKWSRDMYVEHITGSRQYHG